jgi:xanthine/uracil/vitamin C permease (AzgA family)
MLGCGFIIAMFFAPIFSSIPGFATGPALIVVGTMMIGHAREIDWDDLKVAFPSFLTIVLMPLTYSIAYGVLTGILANITLWLLFGIINMTLAAFRRDGVTTPGKVFYGMFQCWRDAFEDFYPGLKAEWKAVFKNKVCAACWCRCCSHLPVATPSWSCTNVSGNSGI